ncbi:DUF3810 domain-containing protein [Mobilitalea sibirica]|uniref:DUF3810 domain-containing protein n=1 Tax=Mobilitalea sibirica TaxID=1462919 RepID=A0A8J7H3M0_9FIRM|nr:DUF3810 domain-containing protein [Mobilitalea sibirica]MBH1941580.1 DUF3810 domain-containing protein [Mobilitalea sibirica]
MKKVLKLKRIYLLILLPVSLILTVVARNSSFFAEQVFARYIYKWISQIISLITGILPFSLAEILVLLLPFAVFLLFIRFLYRFIKKKNERKTILLKGILNILCSVSVLLFLFTIFAGINYHRYSFSHYAKLEVRESSVDELYALTESLAIQANELRAKVPVTDEEGVFQLSESNYQLAKKAEQAMRQLSKEYSVLGGRYGKAKPIMLSSVMSYTEITGIFIPFTMEANVNVDIPDYTIPATMLHEMAHLRGFMREDEANYIAYLAGMESDSVEIKYSSTMLALTIARNALYKQSPDLYFKVMNQCSKEVLKDIRANVEYWVEYEDTVVSTVANKVNDTYLKANAQADGVKSYGRMLDLLLAKYRKDHAE